MTAETNGIFAPAKPGFFAKRREKLVDEYVQEGLKKFDKEHSNFSI